MIVPNGYLTILEAAGVVSQAIYAGVPDFPVVSKLRQEGFELRDGLAIDRAIEEIWKAVDRRRLRVLAVGGRPRRIVRLSPELTKMIPILRSSRGRGFTFLRPSNPVHHQLVSWFGPLFYEAVLAFPEREVEKLARQVMRVRRAAQKPDGQKKPRGRPSRIAPVQDAIRRVIAQRKWNPTLGMKALTREVNRVGQWPKGASQSTVARALDFLLEQTNDRRFERVRRTRKTAIKTRLRTGSVKHSGAHY